VCARAQSDIIITALLYIGLIFDAVTAPRAGNVPLHGAPRNLGVNIFLFFPEHWITYTATRHSLGSPLQSWAQAVSQFFIPKNQLCSCLHTL